MKRFEQLLAELRELPGTKLKLAYKGGEAVVSFPDGRTQTISVRRVGDSYLLTSRVIGSTRVANIQPADLACQIWSRNRVTDIVEFAIDESGRLIGRIEQVADALKRDELEFVPAYTRYPLRRSHAGKGSRYRARMLSAGS